MIKVLVWLPIIDILTNSDKISIMGIFIYSNQTTNFTYKKNIMIHAEL